MGPVVARGLRCQKSREDQPGRTGKIDRIKVEAGKAAAVVIADRVPAVIAATAADVPVVIAERAAAIADASRVHPKSTSTSS
jgi:hypothetical protein